MVLCQLVEEIPWRLFDGTMEQRDLMTLSDSRRVGGEENKQGWGLGPAIIHQGGATLFLRVLAKLRQLGQRFAILFASTSKRLTSCV